MAQSSENSTDKTTYHNFSNFYEDICDKIRASGLLNEIMKEFETFKTDFERVEYVSNMADVRKLNVESIRGKNAEKAMQLEAEYDHFNSEENSARAKSIISQSIQVTPKEDIEARALRFMKRAWTSLLQEEFDHAFIDAQRSLAFGVRSTLIWNAYEILGHCYAKQNLNKKSETYFKHALEGLRDSDYSNEIKAKSTKRISIVFKTIQGRKDGKDKNIKKHLATPANSFKVSYGPHDYLENASRAVELSENEQTGRGLFAAREIQPGDIIIIEEPFAAVLNSEYLDKNCYECFQQVETPLPCSTCSSVWFCNEKCLNEAENGLHRHECKVLPLLYDLCIGKMALLVYRILQKATWKQLKLLRDLTPECLPSNLLPQRPLRNPTQTKSFAQQTKYRSQDYLTTLHLVTNDDKRSFGDLFKRSLSAIYIVKCLEISNFFDEDVSEVDKLYTASLALHHLQGGSCNAYAITKYTSDASTNLASAESSEIGGAIYPTISLTNHSCCPNTYRYSIGTTCILRATKIIGKGSQILDNYGPQFQAMNLEERRRVLKSQYKFSCECPACVEDWPLYPHAELLAFPCPEESCGQPCSYSGSMKKCPNCKESESYSNAVKTIKNRLNEFYKSVSILNKGNVSKALPLLLSHEAYLDKSSIRHPGKHLSDVQEALKRAFLAEGNLIKIG